MIDLKKASRAVVIAPLDAQRLRGTIGRVLRELEIEVVEPEALATDISYTTVRAIDSSDFVVADVSRQNPNVMYELGFAHALRKPTLLVLDQESKGIPSDLAGSQFLVYHSANLSAFRDRLRDAVKQTVHKKGAKRGNDSHRGRNCRSRAEPHQHSRA